MNNPLALIVKLFSQGGIEICARSNSFEQNRQNNQAPFLLRTFIQPDGDIICFASPDAIALPEVIQAHDLEVRRALQSLRRFRMVLEKIIYLTPVPIAFGYFYSDIESLGQCSIWILLSAVLLFFKAFLQHSLNWYIRNKIKKLTT